MKNHEKYIKRCLQLAKLGIGNIAPNPMVGSVIVYKDKIIGEGYHQNYGEAHAEVNAINSVKDKSLLSESTIYVNLEPCSHFGKTPPCADFIIENKIPNVVIGSVDSSSKVCGKGISKLKNAGINACVGILEDECRNLNRRFFIFNEKKRPFVIIKFAKTTDGFIDIDRENITNTRPAWITNEISRTLVHKWRAEESSIMAGTETILKDNPNLNIRSWTGKNPTRLILDKQNRLSKSSNVFDQNQATIIFSKKGNESKNNLEYIKIDDDFENLRTILSELYNRNIQSIIVEGGSKLINSFVQQNLWDEARIFIGNQFFHKGIKAPEIEGKVISIDNLEESKLMIFENSL
ncbi:MAG: bifunctional diaminohydroxyphosphoribosylaminopyrimidine deaminase/5-amino-6-(5-phosphoribosylamino)uracil reductase RibD [Bacteroidetes bacterium]|nr:bifunctional diaminohydroxyphosphoribosylaminopyrimidine deaminase/5-amino-6-(5-phosphoribosylamino)uracil reductase RibD [Bacteroidota bacterium]MBT6686295.1 bifunctional diaminohydroxyphosphoribosylaminopyrimidine deaminase/5-amino-6-(5-phosphoribosylamino)uracil reductase RibD [Bacteroidota bacterium]MBT7145097.1 bifunctional diaminohydroxyphosphoribosylaminopyrimidine deaminase/5-amino-6-(5-phosphoribosylamino)uracil reductase RibD [Bacteroidota bacterium]MBT7490185.1 bifunctional diamino